MPKEIRNQKTERRAVPVNPANRGLAFWDWGTEDENDLIVLREETPSEPRRPDLMERVAQFGLRISFGFRLSDFGGYLCS